MKIEVSYAEIIDKLSILQIKLERITNHDRLKNVIIEYEYIKDIVINEMKFDLTCDEYKELIMVNELIWDAENEKRKCAKLEIFDYRFITAAMRTIICNDRRFEIKKMINNKYNSSFIEEKEHKMS